MEGRGKVRMRNSEVERVVRVEGIGRTGSKKEGVRGKIKLIRSRTNLK